MAAAHRIPSYNKKRVPSNVVQFISCSTKDLWPNNYIEKGIVNANDENKFFSPNYVYFNEHLSPDNKFF